MIKSKSKNYGMTLIHPAERFFVICNTCYLNSRLKENAYFRNGKLRLIDMCLGIPAEIISIEGEMAKVSIGGTIVNASLQLLEDPKIGEFVLLHSGFALEKLSREEAEKTMQLLRELEEFNANDREKG